MTAWRVDAPLREPYRLAFGRLTAFTLIYVRLAADERVGWGEIAPLPGYGGETAEAAASTLAGIGSGIATCADLEGVALEIADRAPMTASALVCAVETCREGSRAAFETPLPTPIPLVGLCNSEAPESATAMARTLVAQGFRTLKLKIGSASVAEDLARIRAAAAALPASGRLRLDANQSLDPEAAVALGAELADLPVELFEQPFGPDCWDEHAALAENLPVPLMLDESIWQEDDVARAATVGARAVKLKLCKHPGMSATLALGRVAQEYGLDLVLGNGVQSVLGNHLEARLFIELGLERAAECNGFAKLATSPFASRFDIVDGRLIDGGVDVHADAPVGAVMLLDKVFTK